MRASAIWAGLTVAVVLPIWVAARSPLLEWREPIYVAAGLAGVVALAAMLVQPLLAGGLLPGPGPRRSRRLHFGLGVLLVAAVAVHVGGLWVTSPPDVVDALLFTSPTPFAAWGVVAMWALFASAGLAIVRARLGLRRWRLAHTALVGLIVAGSVVHALRIEGTMGPVSKAALCALVLAATVKVVADRRVWTLLRRRRNPS
jgi:hypothetical protein